MFLCQVGPRSPDVSAEEDALVCAVLAGSVADTSTELHRTAIDHLANRYGAMESERQKQ